MDYLFWFHNGSNLPPLRMSSVTPRWLLLDNNYNMTLKTSLFTMELRDCPNVSNMFQVPETLKLIVGIYSYATRAQGRIKTSIINFQWFFYSDVPTPHIAEIHDFDITPTRPQQICPMSDSRIRLDFFWDRLWVVDPARRITMFKSWQLTIVRTRQMFQNTAMESNRRMPSHLLKRVATAPNQTSPASA
jgi:hypothetical protein